MKKLLCTLLCLMLVFTMMPMATGVAWADTTSYTLELPGAQAVYTLAITPGAADRAFFSTVWSSSKPTFLNRNGSSWTEYYASLEANLSLYGAKFSRDGKSFKMGSGEASPGWGLIVLTDADKFTPGASYEIYYAKTEANNTIGIVGEPIETGKLGSDDWLLLSQAMTSEENYGVETTIKSAERNLFTVKDVTDTNPTTRTIKLLTDITAGSADSTLVVPGGKNIVLDLNGHVLNRGLISSDINETSNGSVIKVAKDGNLYLIDSNTDNLSHKFKKITEGDYKGLLVLDEDSGTEIITGGCITGGIGTDTKGGGVYALGGLIMEGGNIVGNVTTSGGGIYVSINGTGDFTMNGGTITGNVAYGSGGGVYNQRIFTMNGGTICNNVTDFNGGGVRIDDTGFTMNGGVICNNSAYVGGGVCAWWGASFEMNGGTICNNIADTGGGVGLDGASITLGGTAKIIENFLNMGESKTANNLYLPKNDDDGNWQTPVVQQSVILGTGADGNGVAVPVTSGEDKMSIGVTLESGSGKFTTSCTEELKDCFFSDDSAYYVSFNDDGDYLEFVDAPHVHGTGADTITFEKKIVTLSDLIDLFTNGGSGYLASNIMNGTEELIVAENKTVDLCLNGYVIDLNENYIPVKGTLNLYDCGTTEHKFFDRQDIYGLWRWNDELEGSDVKHTITGGLITNGLNYTYGGNDFYGGAFEVSGTLNMYAGNVVGNTAQYGGGLGIKSDGRFAMNGGRICGNKSYANNYSGGGGVFVMAGGSFAMHNGEIKENIAESVGGLYGGSGGGVACEEGAIFVADGGEITNNSAGRYGGGVYLGMNTADADPGFTCLAAGTPITLSDGSRKPIEELAMEDKLRVFDHETGELASADIFSMYKFPMPRDKAFTLHFTNHIDVTAVGGHCFFDKAAGKYVVLTFENANEFVGHEFYNADSDCWETLESVDYLEEAVDTYVLVSEKTLNAIANGMLSNVDGLYSGLCNIFEMDENLKIDPEKKAQDIERYGIWEYDNVHFPNTERRAYDGQNLQYLGIALGKGIITQEDLNIAIEQAKEYKEYLESLEAQTDDNNSKDRKVQNQSYLTNNLLDKILSPFMTVAYADELAQIPTEPGAYLGGTIKIDNNTATKFEIVGDDFEETEFKNNVCLWKGEYQKIALGTGYSENGVLEPANGMHVGVTLIDGSGNEDGGQFATNSDFGDAQYFFSDNENLYIVHINNHLELKAPNKDNHIIKVIPSDNGKVTASAREEAEGETVTLAVTPNEGYQLKDDTLKANNGDVSIGKTGSNYTFEMPNSAVTVTAEFEIIKCTVTFKMNGHGAAPAVLQNIEYGNTIDEPTPTPTATNYTFGGWYKDQACTQAWNFGSDVVTGDMTLYAKWIEDTVKKAAIAGNVTEASSTNLVSPTNVPGATVELFLGTVKVAADVTDAYGNYSFNNVENGTYNIVVTKADGKTKTELVTVNNENATVNVVLPSGNVNSKVEYAGTTNENAKSDIKQTVVGGLDKIAETLASNTDKITIKLKVEPKSDVDTQAQKDIKKQANGKKVEFLDLSLLKQVNDGEEVSIGDDNNTLLTIVIPFDFTSMNVDSIMILRKHGKGNAEALTKNPAEGQEGFIVNESEGTITIYAMKFSDYAIAYADKNNEQTTGGGGSFSYPDYKRILEEAQKQQAELDKKKAENEKLLEHERLVKEAKTALAETEFRATSTKQTKLNGKKAIKIKWEVVGGSYSLEDFEGFDVFRSTKKYSGYGTKPFFTTKNWTYTNNKDLKVGKTYYYKVRAWKMVDGEKVYTDWSTKAWRTVK